MLTTVMLHPVSRDKYTKTILIINKNRFTYYLFACFRYNYHMSAWENRGVKSDIRVPEIAHFISENPLEYVLTEMLVKPQIGFVLVAKYSVKDLRLCVIR